MPRPSKSAELAVFAEALVRRIQKRKLPKYGDRPVLVLDFRTKEFEALGRTSEMLRNPYAVGWPEAGDPIEDAEEATRWVRTFYAPRVKRELDAKRALAKRPTPQLLVSTACDVYLAKLAAVEGHSRHTLKNRTSVINAYIKPRLGHLAIETLDQDLVSHFLDGILVLALDENGQWVERPASYGYKRDIRACLRSIWCANLRHVPPLFDGLRLEGPSDLATQRKAAFEGNLEQLLRGNSGAQDPVEVRRTLVAAMWYDRHRIRQRTNTSRWAVPNTAEAIAFEIAMGVRSEELVLLRWKCIDEAAGVIAVLGTKSEAAVRYIPLQDTLRPWIARMRALLRPDGAPAHWTPDEMQFVFITNAKKPREMGKVRSMSNRISKALRLAGTKRPKKTQHWARATFAAMAKTKLKAEELKQYLGHDDAFGGATSVYADVLVPLIPDEHRRLIEHLPSPEALEAEMQDFEPTQFPTRPAPGPRPKRERSATREQSPSRRRSA